MFIHKKLETRGLLCPLPLLNAKKALNTMQAGEILEVVSTDPSAVLDFAVFIRQTHYLMLDSWQEGEDFFFVIQKT